MSNFSEYVESDYDELEDREPFRTRVYRKGVGIIEMISFSDETITYCPKCRAAGFQVKLGPRILMPGEVRQPDYENWVQCPSCAEIIATHVIEHDATIIRDDIETVDNPFESNQSEIIGANPRRTTKAGRIKLSKRRKQMNRPTHSKDKDIDREMQRHGDRVKVVYDSNP